MKYYANDKYNAELSQAYIPGNQVLYVTAVPRNVPTIVVAFRGTEKETVFAVTGKTLTSLTGISRLRGANTELDMGTPVTCLNNEEFINQFVNLTGLSYKGEWSVASDYVIDDWVTHLGSAYYCFITPPNHEDPTDTNYWIQFAAKGDPGKEIELQTTETYIQWRYVGDETWNDLVELSLLKGDQGDPGISIVDSDSLIETTLINDTTNTNTYSGSFTVAPTEYKIGMKVNLKVTNANTGSSTLNINGLGAKTIKKNIVDNLVSGDIKAGQIVPLVYDGTNFQIVGGGNSLPSQTGNADKMLKTDGSNSSWSKVGSNNIDDGAITEGKLGSGAVTEGKIGTGAVTVNKIGANAVTDAKMGTTKCAFMAYDNTGGDQTRNGTFPLSTELFDIGNNYNNSTYIFTAPVTGIYTLSWQVYSNSPTQGRAQMITSVGIFTQNGNYGMTVTLYLTAGQTAYMSGANFPVSYYAAQAHNSFSGHLVREIH